jgi:hypothetical protein
VPRVTLTEVTSSEPAEHANVGGTVTPNLDETLRTWQPLPRTVASGATIDYARALSDIDAEQPPRQVANSLPAGSVGATTTDDLSRASDSIDPLESMPLWSPASQGFANQARPSGTSQFGEPQYPARPISIGSSDTLERTATGNDKRIYKEARNAGEF